MRKLLSLIAAATLLASLGLATTAGAATVEWSGTLIVNVGTLPQFNHQDTGVATLNGSAGAGATAGGALLGHINTLTMPPGGLAFSGGNNVPETIPLTDPDNATLITLRATGMRVGKVGTGFLQDPTVGPAVWEGISGGPPLLSPTGRPPGNMKMCILFPGCGNYLPIPFGTRNNTNAVGIGGIFTVNTFSKGHGFKLSVWGAPWTIGLASIKNVTTETPNGAISTYTKTLQGFAHGPASGTSTAAISGVLQVVTPVLIRTSLGTPDTWQAVWTELKLHFIPEPGLLLLLGSGIAGLVLLGRSRMRG
jgi:hypothetical protein